MKPDQSDNRSLSVPSRDQSAGRSDQRDSAAEIMRRQIDTIYDSQSPEHHSSHHDTQVEPKPSNNHDWQNYHTQWQQYYQQYYERYYLQQVEKHRRQTKAPDVPAQATPAQPEPVLTKDEAVDDIRKELVGKMQTHADKIKKSRHFVPLLSALAVMLVFLLLQYNRFLIAQVKAYVSPGSMTSQNLIVDPLDNTKVGPEPKLIIPKLNVDAPIVFTLNSLAESQVQNALRDGVVHYPIPGASSLPGEQGNSVILGHSSNDVFDNGNYKFIFVQLEQLEKGDSFYVNYNSIRYTYTITHKEVILPTEVNKLTVPSDKPQMILITCVPVGTALKRLIIYADQVSPDPAKAVKATDSSADDGNRNYLPGNSPSLFDRLFGR
jgi:sortase A